jgi:hypothetical protein
VRDDRSLGDLFGDLSRQLSSLVRQEVQLAKVEMTQKVSGVGKDVGMMAAGGFVAYAGLLAILAGIIVLVANWIPLWLSALIVGLIVVAAGYFLLQSGMKSMKERDMAPKQTIRSIQETTEWAKGQLK